MIFAILFFLLSICFFKSALVSALPTVQAGGRQAIVIKPLSIFSLLNTHYSLTLAFVCARLPTIAFNCNSFAHISCNTLCEVSNPKAMPFTFHLF